MKAMILAAGEGERLQPLTEEIPKPLLPVANHPLIEYALESLREAGVREVVINLNYRGDMIRQAVGARFRDEIEIHYSEEEEILGTGGGVKRVRGFFGGEPFLLVNADTLLDVELEDVVRFHEENEAEATMVVRDWIPQREFGRVEMTEEGRIIRVLNRGLDGPAWPVIFAGVHVLGARVFDYMPESAYCCINRDCYGRMLEAGAKVCGFKSRGYWRDVGTPLSYFRANMDFIRGVMPAHCRKLLADEPRAVPVSEIYGAKVIRPVLTGPGCRFLRGCRVGPAVILGEGCTVGAGARLERVVGLAGSSFASGERLRGAVRTPAATVVMDEEV